MARQKAIIVGNCQARPMHAILTSSDRFNSFFELELFPAVHVAKEEDIARLHRSLPDAGLLIAQYVSEPYRGGGMGSQTLKALLPSASTFISWPSIYWSGYNPELFYLKDSNKATVSVDFDYHHRVILGAFVNGIAVEDVAAYLADPSSFPASLVDAETGLQNLRSREIALDIKVADLIGDRYRDERMFWTFNHPSNFVLLGAARQMLHLLGIDDDLVVPDAEMLDGTVYDILPGVRDALSLRFGNNGVYRVRSNELSLQQLIDKYYSFYQNRPELAAINASVQ